MITKLESYTRDTVQSAGLAAPAGTTADSRWARACWDIALGLFAAAYVTVVLFDDVESPLLTLLLIVLVGYELIRPHLRNR